jgi:argonaute-like protein implicated in RNA metabolism and viral defense
VLNCLYQSINPKKPNWRKTMKMMKTICTATVLALTLSIPAFAGDISTPGAPIPCATGTSGDTTTIVYDSETGALDDMLFLFMSML